MSCHSCSSFTCSHSHTTPDRTIYGSYDWLRFCQGATDRQCLLRSPVAVAYCDRSLAGGRSSYDLSYERSRDYQRLEKIDDKIHRSVTSGTDQQSIVRSVIAPDDRSCDQWWRRVTDRTINRGIRRPIMRSIMELCDRSYDKSWHLTIDRTINRGTRRHIIRSIVAFDDRSYDQSSHPVSDRSYDQSFHPATDRTINQSSTTCCATNHDWWYDHVIPICDRLRFGIAG